MTEQDKQALIKHFCSRDCGEAAKDCTIMPCHEIELIQEFQTTEPDSDTISRQAAIDAIGEVHPLDYNAQAIKSRIESLPSAQPERRCVNCGRTVNNGGWYEDGRTRCPIEEHYALPKDGYCHLWEKRKDWEDDYVKRAEEGEK